ncbi:uncharacterized protein LOC108088699 [Drosophila ficusphila]|uniref:uncharacterized protein LOC108088699 n=1 Tax=Drosophila ficusphila TaxID=30025 RepID=UPI0007E6F6EA|nr:uncharacterized protein LOC108088699 [Drosophila ficusphila]
MEQSSERQPAVEQEDRQSEELFEEEADQGKVLADPTENSPNSVQNPNEREEEEDRTEEDIAKTCEDEPVDIEEIEEKTEIESDSNSEENQEQEELEKGECKQEGIESLSTEEKLEVKTAEEIILEREELKQIEELEEELPEPEKISEDQIVEEEDIPKEDIQKEEQLEINLEDQANKDALEEDQALKEELPEIQENKDQLTQSLEDLAEQVIPEEPAGDDSEKDLEGASQESKLLPDTEDELSKQQNKETPERIEEELIPEEAAGDVTEEDRGESSQETNKPDTQDKLSQVQNKENLDSIEEQVNPEEAAGDNSTEGQEESPRETELSDSQEELNQEQNEESPGKIDQQQESIPEEQEEEASKPEEDLPNEQVTQFLRQLVVQLWPELGANPELRLNRASAKGDNYLGVVWRLQVASESKRSLVVKLPPQNRVRRKQFFARPCFLRETKAYEVFLPLADMIQEKWNIPGRDRFRQHALCFGTRQDEPNECIVLEDLACAGFSLHNRFLDLSVEHVRQVIRSYAKLHAVTLAAKRQFPERMQKLQQLVDIFEQRREDHALGVYFENLKGSALSSLLSPEDDAYRTRLEAYFARGSYFELLLPLVSGSNCEPFAVICHGDCWNNNILYKRTERGVLDDVRLIDWQLMRYASPVTDLAYFLFTCTSRGFRQRNLRNMLEDYYEELGLHLNRLGEEVEQLLPRPAFDEQVATKAAVGLLLAMMVLPIVTMQGQDVPDLQAISERIEAGATTDLQGAGFLGAGNEENFKHRMREVILDCVDFNYI